MSSTKRVMLSIRQTTLHAPPRSFQSNNGFLGACFTSVINHPQARNITESTSEMAGGAMADTAMAGSMKAMETGREMGEKAMHTVDSALDAAKETTQKVKETVLDEDDNDRQPADSSVEDVRTRERGYD